MIFINKNDLLPDTWSPLREKYPDGNVSLSLSEILKYTVSQSDNNGCDILLKLIGGTKTVNNYIHQIGISDVSIMATEKEMHKSWDVQFSNWTTPKAATQLLLKFYKAKILSEKSFHFLWSVMAETITGAERIKGQLPAGTVVVHKTGTSDTNKEGVTAAVNDIGIVTLPNGNHFAICVFVSDSKEDEPVNDKIIADVTKAAWNYFLHRKQ
jgi:beta-lactamase class A